MKNRSIERSFPFLEIPLNQQTKTHSSGQIQLSQSLKFFQSLCTVSYFPFLSFWISLKSHEGEPRASSLYFSHFLNLFDLLVRPRIKCHVYHGKGNQKLNWRKVFLFHEIFFSIEEKWNIFSELKKSISLHEIFFSGLNIKTKRHQRCI